MGEAPSNIFGFTALFVRSSFVFLVRFPLNTDLLILVLGGGSPLPHFLQLLFFSLVFLCQSTGASQQVSHSCRESQVSFNTREGVWGKDTLEGLDDLDNLSSWMAFNPGIFQSTTVEDIYYEMHFYQAPAYIEAHSSGKWGLPFL